MKRKLQIAILLLISLSVNAQQNYFVYLQTDNKQPFYVKVNSKVLTSSSSGYVVIPKLITGSYPIIVGFAKDKWPQQSFTLEIGTNDAGYLLKNFAEKGWGLYNIQTMEISMNGENEPSLQKTTNEDEAFAKTLSGAANTKIETKVIKEVMKEPIMEPVKEPVKDTGKNITEEIIVVKPNVIAEKVERISSKKNKDGNRHIIYLVSSKIGIDTVDVLINYQTEKKIPIADAPKELETNTEELRLKKVEPKIPETTKDKKFLDINMQNSANNTDKGKEVIDVVLTNKPVVSINSDCKAQATEEDFIKTRKKMSLVERDDDMVEVARKAFKLKCYTVEQIRGLSILFLSDNGKYKFFDSVYPRVSDSQNYASLQVELKDNYYIKRFKVMLRN